MYDPAVGRFTAVDSAQPGIGDPGGQDNYEGVS
jgi:hypothetical protein